MYGSSLRRRQITLDRSKEKHREQLNQTDQSHVNTSSNGVIPGPKSKAQKQFTRNSLHPKQIQSRVYVLLSAVFIGAFMALSHRSSSQALPDTWALCSKGDSQIYTVDDANPTAECIVIHEGIIVDFGSVDSVRKRWGDRDTVGPVATAPGTSSYKTGLKFKYLKAGEAAYPGFTDAHAHIMDYGATRELQLAGSSSIDEVVHRVRDYILSRPEILNDTSIWIESLGWDQNRFPGGKFPIAADLDSDPILQGRPIVLHRVDVHASWVSPRVLEILGELPKTIEGGLILRDDSGKPTGIFVDNAMNLVLAKKPAWTRDQMIRFFQTTMQDALQHGLTSIHDAASFLPHIELYKALDERGLLPIRLTLMAHSDSSTYWGPEFVNLRHLSPRLQLRSVKLFTDGALGSWGAAMLESYSDKPDTRGIMRMGSEQIKEFVPKFIADGWQVNAHCIGDRANHEILDAFERALSTGTLSDSAVDAAEASQSPFSDRLRAPSHRHRLEHAQILTQEDLKRVGELGIIASVQPTHATSDMSYAEHRIGPDRIRGAYAWRTLVNHNVTLALGSDFPVEGINPLLGFYAAITRLDTEGNSPHGPDGWFPEQRLSRAEALRGMTLGPAFAAFQEDVLGSLTVGKRADIVILDRDIMKINPSEILKAQVKATIVDGQLAFGKV